MERKIGEIFEYNGEWYQCLTGYCKDLHRKDICTANLIFKKLEKVGEPYYNYEKKLCQQYKCYINPLVTDEIVYVFADNKVVIEIKQNKEDMEEKNEVKGANVLSKEEWCIIEKAQDDWKRIFPDIPLMSSMSVDAFFPHIIKLGLLDKYKEHSNFEKIGKNLKPFDLQKAREGKPVYTRDGRKARIICFDKRGGHPIIALVETFAVEYACIREEIYYYTIDGREIGQNAESKDDLMMLPEKKEGWVNINKGGSGKIAVSSPYSTKEEAIHNDNEITIDTIKICWEE